MTQEETEYSEQILFSYSLYFALTWQYSVGFLPFFTVEKGHDWDQDNTVQTRFEPEIPT